MLSVPNKIKNTDYYINKLTVFGKNERAIWKLIKLRKEKKRRVKDSNHHINKIIQIQKAKEDETTSIKRFALFPILDELGWKFFKQQEIIHWVSEEIDITADVPSYDRATDQERKVLDTIMAFFLSGDGAVSDNLIF